MSNRAASGYLWLISCGALLVSCARVPAFHTSVPVESASSLPEALRLCDEYSLPKDPSRPVLLRPFLDCVNKAGDRFPGAAISGDFGVFRAELRDVYQDLNTATWTPRVALELEIAIHSILRYFWREGTEGPGVSSTATERDTVLRHFARTARAIRADKWNVGQEPVLEPRLESLRALVAGLADSGEEAAGPAEVAPGDVALLGTLCERYGQLSSELKYLSSLWQDLVDMTLIDPQSDSNEKARRRYFERLDRTMEEGQRLRADIQRARESAGFRLGACGH